LLTFNSLEERLQQASVGTHAPVNGPIESGQSVFS
jgi:hypothetical protein